MTQVLFVCTGNIFRSLTAEYALRSLLTERESIIISSAGTRHAPELQVRSDVERYLYKKGFDVSAHRRRTVSTSILSQSDVVISMNTDHQQTLRDSFQMESFLFTEACAGKPEAMPDIDDLFAPEEHQSAAALQHIHATIDQIIALTPLLFYRLSAGWPGTRE